ncbi:MAG: alpha/beta hydrolase [Candidatus Aminicenantes bacterium]|nr:alpha/beta hydrolase [Candidatus Aminicenantes bacterium]
MVIATIFILSMAVSGGVAGPLSQTGEKSELAVVDTLVAVEGIHLNFRIIEGGSPVIVLEAGGAMDLTEWDDIALKLARKTGATVISYDRAGFGKSDLPDIPCDMKTEAGWLWEALKQLGFESDIILAGHSYGGWMIRIEASENPEAVIGMVFIDPFSAELVEMLGVEYLDNHPMSGKIPFDTSQPDKLSKYQRALVRMVGDGLGPKLKTMKKTVVPKDIPVFIIKSALPFLPKEEEQKAWNRALDEMAASIDGAVVIVAEESNHMIPLMQPDLIVDTVMEAVRLSGSK